jgi:hypothetical protein
MTPRSSTLKKIVAQPVTRFLTMALVIAAAFTVFSSAAGSNHYTEKQLSVLAQRVGKIFWIQEVNGRTPHFLTAADIRAGSFPSRAGDSFRIVELVGRKQKNPFYRVEFASGKQGYLQPEAILEELNLTLLTVDPLADEKRRAAEEAAAEKSRVDWINAQPWPAATKQAALRGEVTPGMTTNEVKRIAGAPAQVVNSEGHGTKPEEHWYYPDGKQLIFHRGLLSRITLSGGANR